MSKDNDTLRSEDDFSQGRRGVYQHRIRLGDTD